MEDSQRRSKAVWITSIAFAAVILAATAGGRWILDRQTGEQARVSSNLSAPAEVSTDPMLKPSAFASPVSIASLEARSETPCLPDSAESPSCEKQVQAPEPEQIFQPQTETLAPLDLVTPSQTPATDGPERRTAPVIGGADKVAFLNEGEMWVVNLDGGALGQLTSDGNLKSNLQWSLDGQSVYFLSGNCIQSVDLVSAEVHSVLCVEEAGHLSAFQFSPEGDRLSLVLDQAMYVIRNDTAEINRVMTRDDLKENATCPTLAPYIHSGRVVPVRSVRWSRDGGQLAVVRPALDDDRLVDLVHLLDITECESIVRRLDEFPGKRFSMEGYDTSPFLQNIAWDGWKLFALIGYRRNGGFGDLWVYNEELYHADLINPVEGACCYRDPFFSPDGEYLLFAFQDKRLAPESEIRLYYVPLATVGTGLAYAPIPLPEGFFPDPRSRPQPVLRTAR